MSWPVTWRENVATVKQYFALGALIRIKIVHPVEDAQQSRFSAAGRADEGRHLVLVERKTDVLERLRVAIVKIETSDRNLWLQARALGRSDGC